MATSARLLHNITPVRKLLVQTNMSLPARKYFSTRVKITIATNGRTYSFIICACLGTVPDSRVVKGKFIPHLPPPQRPQPAQATKSLASCPLTSEIRRSLSTLALELMDSSVCVDKKSLHFTSVEHNLYLQGFVPIVLCSTHDVMFARSC